MATKEFVQERINNTKAKIEKAKKIIAKKTAWIEKKKAELEKTTDKHERYWIQCDISSYEGDIKSKEKELQRELFPSLEKWNQELIKIQQVKRDIPILVEFLDFWKTRVAEYYRNERTSEDRKAMKQEVIDAKKAHDDQVEAREHKWWPSDEEKEKENELWKAYRAKESAYNERYKDIILWESKGDFETEMEKDLQRDWEAKYDRLVEDTTRLIGTITDCRGLSVSGRGELNGIIVGENGKAKITTFLAGGHTIQCLHWRCKITKLKDI